MESLGGQGSGMDGCCIVVKQTEESVGVKVLPDEAEVTVRPVMGACFTGCLPVSHR